jgi:hypothetical protein
VIAKSSLNLKTQEESENRTYPWAIKHWNRNFQDLMVQLPPEYPLLHVDLKNPKTWTEKTQFINFNDQYDLNNYPQKALSRMANGNSGFSQIETIF